MMIGTKGWQLTHSVVWYLLNENVELGNFFSQAVPVQDDVPSPKLYTRVCLFANPLPSFD